MKRLSLDTVADVVVFVVLAFLYGLVIYVGTWAAKSPAFWLSQLGGAVAIALTMLGHYVQPVIGHAMRGLLFGGIVFIAVYSFLQLAFPN